MAHESLKDRFEPLITSLRQRRKPIDENWLLYHSAWRGKNTRSFFKSEIFSHYVPASRRSVERFVIRAAQMLVPSGDFFEVYPGTEGLDNSGLEPDKQAEAVRAYLQYIFTKRIRIYGLIRKLLRSYAIFGRAITKSGVEIVSSKYRIRGRNAAIEMVWPTVRDVDPFMFYVFPETVTDLDNAQIIAEDVMMPYDTYQAFAKNASLGITQISQEKLKAPVWPEYQQRRLQAQAIPTPDTISQGKSSDSGDVKQLVEYVALTEIWYREDGSWKMCWLVWNLEGGPEVVRVKDKPFHPYRMASARDIAGEHYGTGMMDDLEPTQVLLNDQVNMTLEGMATQFSPPAVIDPDLIGRAGSLVFRPRAKWFVKPEGVKWLEAKDTTKMGFAGIQFTLGLMDGFSGSNPLAEGSPTRNMPRAGFAISSMLNLALSDIKDAAQMVEDHILTPMLGDVYRLTLEYVSEKQIIRIPGTSDFAAMKMKAGDLFGDFSFRWIGSLQSQDYQVRSQRLMALMTGLAKLAPIMAQQLQFQGKTIDWEYMWKKVWREGLGERGAGSFIRKMTPQEIQQMMQMMAMQAQASQKPPVRISLSGQLDPFTANELSGAAGQVPPEVILETVNNGPMGKGAAPKGGGSSGGGRNLSAPASGEAADRQLSAGMSRGQNG